MKPESRLSASDHLAQAITWAASKQTYLTIRLFVDRERIGHAYRTYAYFRWLDDRLDQDGLSQPERIAFVERQKAVMERLFSGERPKDLCAEEEMLAELVQSDSQPESGLRIYIHEMMAVMSFDAYRRGRLISQKELTEYTRWLAVAVTEAMHYFIGHACRPPREGRYLAVTAAHIAHMLRDAQDDTQTGYINIPREYLESAGISARDAHNPAYRKWVRGRVELARTYFQAGQAYLRQVPSLRCRLAGYAYIARFTGLLDLIEADGYRLRAEYPPRKLFGAGLKMAWEVLGMALSGLRPALPARDWTEI
jgi:phytoene/squalene synthetase